MAQLPIDVYNENLAIINGSQNTINVTKSEYNNGAVSKQAALLTVNSAKTEAQNATNNLASYARANQELVKSQGLENAFPAAQKQGASTVKFADDTYAFIQNSSPNRANVGDIKNELLSVKNEITQNTSNFNAALAQLKTQSGQNLNTEQLAAAKNAASNLQRTYLDLQSQLTAYKNKANAAGLTSEANWAQSTSQALLSLGTEVGNVFSTLQLKTPSAIPPTAPQPSTAETIEAQQAAPRPPGAPLYGDQNPFAGGTSTGLEGQIEEARVRFTEQDATNLAAQGDWRIKLSLAPGSPNILYNNNDESVGILKPLRATDGIVFPYVPNINVNYTATYDYQLLTHSNYKIATYQGSSVEQITIVADFTAQDTYEANYLLAVIHFLRSATKMFYGLEESVKPGTPPPLCFLNGLGEYQFNQHPLVITSFAYILPNNVNYIRAQPDIGGYPGSSRYGNHIPNNVFTTQYRLGKNINEGGYYPEPDWGVIQSGSNPPTYVPTSISLTIMAYPVVSRNEVSNVFSNDQYASGALLQGSRRNGGGFW